MESRGRYDVRFEWGPAGAAAPWSLSPAGLRRAPFTPRLVLPSPNGSAICAAAAAAAAASASDGGVTDGGVTVIAGCLRNAAVFPTMLGFTTWAYALARTPSGTMGATTYAVPGLVVLMSWLILGQVPRWLTIAGGALCLAGVAVTRSRSARKATPAPLVTVPGQPKVS